MLDLTTVIADFHLELFLKIFIVLLLFLYNIAVFMLFTNIRSLDNVVFIRDANASQVLQFVALFYLIASLSLFFLSLVIL